MTFSFGSKGELGRRLHDDPPAGEPLAQIVVGVADQPQRDAAGEKRAETLAGRAVEGDLRSCRRAGPRLPHRLTMRLLRIVPTVRWMLRIGIGSRVGLPSFRCSAATS